MADLERPEPPPSGSGAGACSEGSWTSESPRCGRWSASLWATAIGIREVSARSPARLNGRPTSVVWALRFNQAGSIGGARCMYPFDESRGVAPAMGSVFCAQCAADPGDGFDGVEFLRADTHRGWGIASMARAAAG